MSETPSWRPLEGEAHRVAVEVLIHGPIARSELARRLGLSPSTLTRVARPLIQSGLVREYEAKGQAGPTGTGRPVQPLDIDPASRHFIGVKITSDQAHGVLTDLRANVVESRIVPIADREPEAVVEVVAALASELGAGVDKVSALGVSAGGLTEDYKILRQAAYMGWEDDVPLARMLEEATGLPSAVDNDVAAWTEAERWFGSGKNRPDFALVTTGAGIGYSLVSQGNLVAGREVGVGSLAHVPLDPLGPPCSQGHHGCAEAMLTTDAITKQVSLALGRPVEYAEALELSQNGNPAARSTVRAAARAYGRLLALVANTTFSPYIIVSGEGVDLAIDQKELVLDEFQAGRHPCAQHVEIELKPAPFTEWARGAAVTAIQTYVLGRA